MQVAILEAGAPPAPLDRKFGRYPDMFRRLLGPEFDVVNYDVQRGHLPREPEDHPAYLVTGSPAGVYDDLPWIPLLRTFLQQARGAAKLVGICFGHQIMAEAFGGHVEKSDKGWGVGLHRYEIIGHPSWTDGTDSIAIPVSHQDQIVVLPPTARVIGGSQFTPFGVIDYGDSAMSMQCHPEFGREYAQALIEVRRDRLPDPDSAIESLSAANDSLRVAEWMKSFLRRS